VLKNLMLVERWLSWSKAHDWKSCTGFDSNVADNPHD